MIRFFGIVWILSALILIVNCSLFLYQPSTHEEWAQKCLGKNDPEEFKKCLEEWHEWEKIVY